jgi:ABC-type branched-subunit amino acid transport system ATPase component
MADPLLAIEGLYAGYGTTEILRGIDLAVNEGEVVAVLGSNGAGKSTLNLAISGVLRPWRGTIHFAGAAIERVRPSAIVARGLIQVPEGRRIFPNMSVGGGARKTANGCSASSRGSPSGKCKAPARCPAASSRCSRSDAA